MSSTQVIDTLTPFKSRPAYGPASLEHQFDMFKVIMEFKVAACWRKLRNNLILLIKITKNYAN